MEERAGNAYVSFEGDLQGLSLLSMITSHSNPVGGHSHATPRHQAAGRGHQDVVQLLVERGARTDIKDILWQATPADWARHASKLEIEAFLRGQDMERKQKD